MRIFAIGYCCTGSSAIVHLLNEYENVQNDFFSSFEHIVFYTPHGLFDLEETLLHSNTIHRSDAAINDFYEAMKKLNDFDYGWCGGYQAKYGDRFMQIVDDFVNSLVEYSHNGRWDNDYNYIKGRVRLKSIAGFVLRRIMGKKVRFPTGVRFDKSKDDGVINYCFDTPQEFYKKAKKFIDSYFELIGYSKDKVMVFDQALQPQHLKRFIKYANEDDRFIVVKRDVRDIYLQSKYVWSKYDNASVFPQDPLKFVSFYKRFLTTEVVIDDPRVLRVNFEDLIYKYDETISMIEKSIGKDKLGHHVNANNFFKPEQSICNTQTFLINDEYKKEVAPLYELLPECCYNYPYEKINTLENITDPNPHLEKH